MALSKVNINVSDGNLGQVSPSGAENAVHFGVCTKGTPGQLYVFNSLNNITSKLGYGSGAEAVAYALAVAGGPVSFVPVEPSLSGSIGSVTHVGSGTATITPTAVPVKQITITYVATGAPGTGTFKYAVGTDGYSAPLTIPGNADGYAIRIPGTYTDLTFAGAGTYTAGDGYLFNTDGTNAKSGSSSGVTPSSDPVDDYTPTLTVTVSGATGTAKGVLTVDGYNQLGGEFTLSAAYPVSNRGLLLTASGTFVAGDTYSFQTCGPDASASAYESAATGLQTPVPFSMLHFNNKSATASAAATMAADIDLACSALFDQYRFVRAMVSCPTAGSVSTVTGSLNVNSEAMSATIAAFTNQASTRVGAGAYDAVLASSLSGDALRRNFSNVAVARLAQVDPATDAAWVGLGPVTGVIAISNDEFYDEGLSDAGFTTPRTIPGRSGVYVNQALTFSFKNASDYSYFADARIMDEACVIAYGVLVNYLNAAILVNPQTGAVLNSQAVIIETRVDNALASRLINVSPRQVSAASCTIDRSNNILSSSELIATITITPPGYARNISLTIGFGLQS